MRVSAFVRGFVLTGVAASVVAFGPSTAVADEPELSSPEADVVQLQTELESKGVVPSESSDGSTLTKQYAVETPDAPRMVFETSEPAPTPPGQVQPRVRVGVGYGVYIYLNPVEQRALIYGGAAGISAAACAGLGAIGCGTVTGALTAGAVYLAENGFCANDLEINFLRPTVNPFDSEITFKCV
jgi:hypothetical protein